MLKIVENLQIGSYRDVLHVEVRGSAEGYTLLIWRKLPSGHERLIGRSVKGQFAKRPAAVDLLVGGLRRASRLARSARIPGTFSEADLRKVKEKLLAKEPVRTWELLKPRRRSAKKKSAGSS